MKQLLRDITLLLLFCALWYCGIRVWYWYDARNGPNIFFQEKPKLDTLEKILEDLPTDVKFLIFQLLGCTILLYFLFYFSSFFATGPCS